MKIIICMFVALLVWFVPLGISAQMTTDSRIYICTDANGAVRLNNIKSGSGCVERVVKIPVVAYRPVPRAVSYSNVNMNVMGDPQPASNALLVGSRVPSGLQARRDVSRIQILQAELSQAQRSLFALQSEYQNGMPEHMGDAKIDKNHLSRMDGLKRNILLTQANIGALQRELEREQSITVHQWHTEF
jgi:hypothetical protein